MDNIENRHRNVVSFHIIKGPMPISLSQDRPEVDEDAVKQDGNDCSIAFALVALCFCDDSKLRWLCLEGANGCHYFVIN